MIHSRMLPLYVQIVASSICHMALRPTTWQRTIYPMSFSSIYIRKLRGWGKLDFDLADDTTASIIQARLEGAVNLAH